MCTEGSAMPQQQQEEESVEAQRPDPPCDRHHVQCGGPYVTTEGRMAKMT